MTKTNIGTVTVTDGVASIQLDTKDLTEGTYNIITRYNQNNEYTESTTTETLTVNTATPLFTVYMPCNIGTYTARSAFTEEQEYCYGEYMDYLETSTTSRDLRIWVKDDNNTPIQLIYASAAHKIKTYDNQGIYGIKRLYTNNEVDRFANIQILPNPYLNDGGGNKQLLYCYNSIITNGGITV